MTSIENIWDAPVTLDSPKTPRHLDAEDDDEQVQRPAKRQKQALFLSDSEDEGGDGGGMRRGVAKAPPPIVEGDMDNEVEALFADAENDDGLSFKRVGDLDVAAMEREAEARHRKNTPLTPHPVLPSSPAPNDGAQGGATGESRGNKDKGKGKEQQKRPRPVLLNENLLLGPTGFPDLISQVKDFKIKGKGREIEDLTRLMRIYSFWTHKLHPKLKFRDTVERIEKLCHTKRMQVALSVWKDEAHGKTRELDADLSLDSDGEDGQTNAKIMNVRSGRQPSISASSTGPLRSSLDSDQEHSSIPPSSRASSHPPTSDFPDDDDLFGPSTSASNLNGHSASTSTTTKKRIVVDDDEVFWNQLEAAQHLQSLQPQQKSQATPAQTTDDLDDADLWAALEATNQASVASSKTGSGSNHPGAAKVDEMDIDDDDMWDIVRANEQVAPAPPPAVAEASRSTSEQASIANQSLAESEMDWDDMYAN